MAQIVLNPNQQHQQFWKKLQKDSPDFGRFCCVSLSTIFSWILSHNWSRIAENNIVSQVEQEKRGVRRRNDMHTLKRLAWLERSRGMRGDKAGQTMSDTLV